MDITVRDEPLIIVGVGGRVKLRKKKEVELTRRKKRKYPNLGEKSKCLILLSTQAVK